ncbi:MAG TPA: hypothetical protein VGC78_15540 [Gaiellaceae bacterium]|jgi:hypothetical protein
MNEPAAGALAALAWAAVEPLDRRLFRHDYSDVAMLGKLVTRSRAWPAAGLAVHVANGAAFGAAYRLARRRGVGAVQLALLENTALFPLAPLIDRFHPARGSRRLAPLFTARGFAQATARHLVFGAVLGALAGRSPSGEG